MTAEKKDPKQIIGTGSRSSLSGTTGKASVTSRGTGLTGQDKTPKDLRDETFLAPEPPPVNAIEVKPESDSN